ncbi:CD8A protein, partial [Neodrepanis coruscans]|nr:CD8A protein [Neodrepanis coruscans]
MDWSPALLLLLALALCEYGHRAHDMRVAFSYSTIQVKVGQRLELKCPIGKEDRGMSWLYQNRAGNVHNIVFISPVSQTTFTRQNSSRFEASKDNSFYRLVVKSFTPQDEGNYFCLTNNKQELYFSPGQPAFFSVTTTPGPATSGNTTQHGITKKDPYIKAPGTEIKMQEDLNFFCISFIWVPLTGLCLLLLQLLAVTIVL